MVTGTIERAEQVYEQKWWQSPWVVSLSLALAVVSIALSIYLYFASRAEKAPVYQSTSAVVVEPALPTIKAVTVMFGDKPVKRVTSTTIKFWNAGKRTIEAADITVADPLRIPIPQGITVLSANLVKRHRSATQAKVVCRNHAVYVSFDFLDHADGGEVQILHDGDVKQQWQMCGTIKGALPVRPLDMSRGGWPDAISGVITSISGLLVANAVRRRFSSHLKDIRLIISVLLTYAATVTLLFLLFYRVIRPLWPF